MKSLAQLHRERLLLRSALVVLALLAVLLQGAYFYNMLRWQHAPDRGWILFTELGPHVIAQTRPLGYRAGLRNGDVILHLNGASYETSEELLAILETEVGQRNRYELRRGDEVLTVEVGTQPLGFAQVFMQSGVFWTLGLLITALGFLVFAMKPFQASSWAFLVMCVLLGMVIPPFGASQPSFEPEFLGNVLLFAFPLMPASLLTLGMLFPQRKQVLLGRKRWLLLPYVISLTLGIVSRHFGIWVGSLPPNLLIVIYLYALGSVLTFLGATVYDYYRARLVSVRLQALVIFTGVALSFFVPVMQLVSNVVFGVSILPNLVIGYALCLIFFPLSIGYAIARHDLFEISTVVRRTYGYILSSAAVVGAYGIVLSALNLTAFANVSESRIFSLSFLLVVAFTFEPIHRRSQGFVDRIFYRQRYDYRRTITEATEEITSLLEPELVRTTLVGTVVREMFLENGMLLTGEGDEGTFEAEAVAGIEWPPGRPREIRLAEPVLEVLKEQKLPLFRHEIELAPHYQKHREEMEACFDELEAELMLPMVYQDQLRAVLSIGRKKSGKMFRREDLDLLRTLAAESAVALENARLFDDLAESLKQVQMLDSIKSNLAKFVPQTVQDMLEESPDAAGLFEKREKDLTVMFADMTGYTRISSHLPLDEVNAIVERYFGAFLDEILRHGGDVNETAGDGLMVLFQDEDPERHARAAVRAALGIQRLTREINAERAGQLPIGMHIGVNSGVAAVGATKIQGGVGMRWTYTATGPITNVAARVGALGEEFAITQETRRRLGDEFEVEEIGPKTLKNVGEPVLVHRVVGARGAEVEPAP